MNYFKAKRKRKKKGDKGVTIKYRIYDDKQKTEERSGTYDFDMMSEKDRYSDDD